ncbi:MAG: helix-turn-helix domain-containing protein [Lachnospiraceae bacterium]|nr:helix-turn-helix domain-containing protein [Lachnospiraceae bacterium]
MKKKEYGFGQSLRYIRQIQGISIRSMARDVNKTPTYISDIERGNNKPPEKELMEQIINALELREMEIQNHLYDLAAIERGGVPEDIIDYIMENGALRSAIRLAKQHGDSEDVWKECIERMQ